MKSMDNSNIGYRVRVDIGEHFIGYLMYVDMDVERYGVTNDERRIKTYKTYEDADRAMSRYKQIVDNSNVCTIEEV